MAALDIVGGGIAGLTLAATLRRPAWKIALHERSTPADRARGVDTAFGLWPPAMAALDAIGLGDAVRERSLPLGEATVRTAEGRVITRVTGQDVTMIGRRTLHDLLMDALPSSIAWEGTKVEDSTVLAGDVVVGADGAFSTVRRDHWGARSAARAQGVTVVRGVVDGELGGDALSEYWGDGMLFGCNPMPGERTNWFCVFDERRFDSVEEGLEHTRHALHGFPDQVADVARRATAAQTLIGGIAVTRMMPNLVRGRAVLIGDAAHAMYPNLGRGACEAIRDAVALGTLLNTRGPAEALARYRRIRTVGPQAVRTLSGATASLALASGGTARRRDRLLSLPGAHQDG